MKSGQYSILFPVSIVNKRLWTNLNMYLVIVLSNSIGL